MKREENAIWVTVSADEAILKYIVEKYNNEIVVSGAHLTELYEKYVESLKERGVIK